MNLPFRIKLNQKIDRILHGGYGVLVLLIVLLLVYLSFFENVSVSHTREISGYQTIETYDCKSVEDAAAPAGIRKEFSWTLEDLPEGGNCLAFYLVHQWAEVSIDGEIVYQLKPQEGNYIGGSIGCNWVMVPLRTADIGKEIQVDILPIYDKVVDMDITFLVGSQMQIYLDQLKQDLPLLILSILAIVVGVGFLAVTALDRYLKRKSRNLGYLGLFSVMVGLWKLADLQAAPLLFPNNPMVLSYMTLSMLLVFSIALMLFIKREFSKQRYYLLDIVCGFSIIYGLVVTLLQMTGIMDFKENLHHTHLVLLAFVAVTIYVMVCEWKYRKENLRIQVTLICFLLCAVGMVADLFFFYVNNTSSGLLYTISSFLIYVVAMGVLSNRELTQKARIDKHTGLYNKSSCNEMLEDETILRGNTSLIMFDLNYLKRVNDTMGHDAGDRLISCFAGILRKTIRISDFVGRYGGDEFIVIAKGASKENAERILRDVSGAVESHNTQEGHIKISYAAGYAVSSEFTDCTMGMLLEKADERMYIQKQKMHQEME